MIIFLALSMLLYLIIFLFLIFLFRVLLFLFFFFFSSRRRHTRWNCDWSSDVCSSDLGGRRRRGSARGGDDALLPPRDAPEPRLLRPPGPRPLVLRRRDLRAPGRRRSEERRVGKECRARWSTYH